MNWFSTSETIVIIKFVIVLNQISKGATEGAPQFNALVGGGEAVQIEQYPWEIFFLNDLRNESTGEYTSSYGGGFLVSSCYAMTAAHLFTNESVRSTIIFGSDNVTHYFNAPDEYITRITAEVFVHPYYKGVRHDIALALFNEPIEFSDTIQPLKLSLSRINDLHKRRAHFVGYGDDLSE